MYLLDAERTVAPGAVAVRDEDDCPPPLTCMPDDVVSDVPPEQLDTTASKRTTLRTLRYFFTGGLRKDLGLPSPRAGRLLHSIPRGIASQSQSPVAGR
jgi:hypothetical protein